MIFNVVSAEKRKAHGGLRGRAAAEVQNASPTSSRAVARS